MDTTKREFLAHAGLTVAAGAVLAGGAAAATVAPTIDGDPGPVSALGAGGRRRKILITGAGTGFGHGVALRLAERGHDVIATVELASQITQLRATAKQRGVPLRVEKVDILSDRDRAFAASFDFDILLNNAGIGQGGSVAEMPMDVFRSQFETNVFSALDLTQKVVRRWVDAKKPGRILFVSSVLGLYAPPFVGAYSASKHALEAIAASMHDELKPFGIKVATINPGPYLTGFNDRMLESYKDWYDPQRNFIDHTKLKFPSSQFDPSGAIDGFVAIIEQDGGKFRNVVPATIVPTVREQQARAWEKDA